MSPPFQRAVLLYQQSRYDLAAGELRRHLAEDPRDADSHALLGICLAQLEDFRAAEAELGEAIVLAPDSPYPHYCRSIVLEIRNRFDDAEQAAREAVALDPMSATYHGQLASTLFAQRKWRAAHDAAATGLQHDPDDSVCANLRTMALSKLGDQTAAIQSVDEVLARQPEDALSHANKGWTLLHQHKPKPALDHFREALRLQPTLEYARSGMVEALKARNPLYRWMLAYFLWMARLDRRVQWGVILGGYFGMRMLRGVADANPEFAPWIAPLIIAYVVFVLLTWFAVPLFNLLLRLSRYGRHALSRDQTVSSNWFAGCLALFVVGAVGAVASANSWFVVLAIVGAGMGLPLTTLYMCDPGWPRKGMAFYAAGMGLIGIGWLAAEAAEQVGMWQSNSVSFLAPLFLLGIFISPFVANHLVSATVRK